MLSFAAHGRMGMAFLLNDRNGFMCGIFDIQFTYKTVWRGVSSKFVILKNKNSSDRFLEDEARRGLVKAKVAVALGRASAARARGGKSKGIPGGCTKRFDWLNAGHQFFDQPFNGQ